MLRDKLQADQITALKGGDKEKLSTIRFIIAQIKNQEIEKKSELNEEEVTIILKKIAKELKESILAFEKGARIDLVDQNKKQLEIVSSYLPPELSDEELKQAIDKIIKENQSIIDNNPKAIISVVMKALRTKADSSRIMGLLSPFIK